MIDCSMLQHYMYMPSAFTWREHKNFSQYLKFITASLQLHISLEIYTCSFIYTKITFFSQSYTPLILNTVSTYCYNSGCIYCIKAQIVTIGMVRIQVHVQSISSLKSTSQVQSWCHLQQNTESRNTIHIFTQILKYHVFNIYTKSTKRSAHFFFSFSEGNLLKSCNNLHKHTLVSKQK